MSNNENVFVLWKRKTEKEKPYFTGMSDTKQLIGFYGNNDDVALTVYERPAEKEQKIDYNNPLGIFAVFTSKKGDKYLKGKFEGKPVTAFINKEKKSEKSPDITAKATSESQYTFFDMTDDDLPF